MNELLHKEENYQIIGACFEVHQELGCGFLEGVYQEALAKEFIIRGISFEREVELPIFYKGEKLNKKYIADFICFQSIILELKALDDFRPEHIAQVINYLKATKFELGLLINFGTSSLIYERVIRLREKDKKTFNSR